MKRLLTYITTAITVPFLLYSANPVFAQNSSQRQITSESTLETKIKQNSLSISEKQIPHYLKDLTTIKELKETKNLNEIQKEIAKVTIIQRVNLTRSLSTKNH